MENNTEQQNEQPQQPTTETPASQAAVSAPASEAPVVLPTTPEEKQWFFYLYLAGLIPVVGPVIVWQMKKQEIPLLDQLVKPLLNFQISWFILYIAVLIVTRIILAPILGCFSSIVPSTYCIVFLIVTILGILQAKKGELYKFPLTFDVLGFVKSKMK